MKASLVVSTLLIQASLLLPAYAEEPRRLRTPPASQPEAPQSVRIIKLVNASPDKVSSMLYEVYKGSGWRFVPDERTKSLFISGPGDPPPAMMDSIKEVDGPSPEDAVRVYQLKFANADEICRLIQNLPHDQQFRCSADPSGQRIIIRAGQAEWALMDKLIAQLDVPYKQGESSALRVIPLKRQLSNDLLKELVAIIGANNVKLAFDNENNSLIASGSPETTEKLLKLLQQLDTGPAIQPKVEENTPGKSEPFRIRLVWLTSASGGDVPPDLKPVVEELAGIGTHVPFLVTQTIVQTSTGNANLIARPADTELRLDCERGKTKGMYNVSLQAFKQIPSNPGQPVVPGGKTEIVNIRTELQVPFDHPIVLAVTPTQESETSAFVLEFLAAK